MMDVTPLFAPLQVGQRTLRNRIVMPPMVVNRGLATPAGDEGDSRRLNQNVPTVFNHIEGAHPLD